MRAEDAQHKQVRLALRASCAVEQVLDAHPRDVRLPEGAANEFHRAVQAFLVCANALTVHYAALGEKRFNFTIKFHYLAHAAEQARSLNPRLGWCYAGEDYMAKVKRVAASCLRGTAANLVSAKVAKKYTLGMQLRMAGQDRQ